MVTVDDLVISLTIKETGRLGRLQKQLDAVVGKRGQRLGFGLGVLGNIPADIAFIKRQIQWIKPEVLPTREQPKQMRKTAAIILKQLEDYGDDIVDKIARARSKEGFKKEVGAKTDAELKQAIRGTIEKVKASLTAVVEETSPLTLAKQEEALALFTKLISQALHGREIGRMLWREIGKLEPEAIFKGAIYDLFRAIGGGAVETEKSLFKVKPEALEKPEIQEALGIGKYPTGFAEMFEWIENAIKTGGEITRSVTANIADWMAQKTVADLIGAQNSPDAIAEKLNEILKAEGSERIKEIMEEIKSKLRKPLTPEEVAKLPEQLVFEETADELAKIMKDVYGWSVRATEGARAIDVHVENFDKIGKELGAQITGLENIGVELKKVVSKANIKQLAEYAELYGKENIVLIAEQIADGVIEYARSKGLEKNLIILTNLRKRQEKFGLEKPILTAEEIAKHVKDLTQDIEDQKNLIRDYIEHPETMTKEQLEKIVDFLSAFPKRLGLNPSQIDLPGEFSKLPTKEDISRDLQGLMDLIEENADFPNILETLEFTKNELLTLADLIEDLESVNEEIVRNAVEELAKRLGINPNQINLPDFIRNVGSSILDLASEWRGQEAPGADLIQKLFTIVAREIAQQKEFTDLDLILSSLQKIQAFMGERPEIGAKIEEMPYLIARLDSIIKTLATFQSDMKDMLSKKSYEPQRQNAPRGF